VTAVSEDKCKSRAGGVTLKEAATTHGSAAQDTRRCATRDGGAAAQNALWLAAAVVRLPAAVRHGEPADTWWASMVAQLAGQLSVVVPAVRRVGRVRKPTSQTRSPADLCTSSRRLPSALALGQADDGTLLVRAALRLKRVRLIPAGAMFAWRRVAPPLLLLLLLLVQGVAHGTSESHIISNEQPVPAADESGEGVDARNSVVGISVSGVEPEVRPQAFRLSIPLCAKS